MSSGANFQSGGEQRATLTFTSGSAGKGEDSVCSRHRVATVWPFGFGVVYDHLPLRKTSALLIDRPKKAYCLSSRLDHFCGDRPGMRLKSLVVGVGLPSSREFSDFSQKSSISNI